MKLTKSLNRKSKDTEYHKYIVTIPKKYLDVLEWDNKTDLSMRVSGDKLVLEKTKKK